MKPFAAAALPCLLAWVAPALAAPPRIDASMLLSGHIVVSPQGTVRSYAIDHADQVPTVVMQQLARAIPRWRFVPVTLQGKPVTARSTMHVRMVARPLGNHRYRLRVGSAEFGDGRHGTAATFRFDMHGRPIYPLDLSQQRVSGTVYLVMRIDPAGRVDRIAAEQVNLRTRGPDPLMKRWRRELARSAMTSARHWTFTVPTEGPRAGRDHWVVRVPVTYRLREVGRAPRFHYGEWIGYIPGPRQHIPWLHADERSRTGADALADGHIAVAGVGLQRLPAPHS